MVIKRGLATALLLCLALVSLARADGMDLARQGLAAQRSGDFDQAVKLYSQAIEGGDLIPPDLAVVLTNRGDSFRYTGQVDKAVADYKAAIKAEPQVYSGYNSLAWVRATNPDEKYRDGKEALELALKAVELSDEMMMPACLDTLAAAYAETGNYREAVKRQKEALGLVKKQGAVLMVGELEERLKTYKSNQPWRDVKKN